jgi:hypothetical protein
MTPEQAEAEAARQGLGPIATKPNPIYFDPDKISWWSLPTSIAWIAWRTAASVLAPPNFARTGWNGFPALGMPTEDGQRFEQIEGV